MTTDSNDSSSCEQVHLRRDWSAIAIIITAVAVSTILFVLAYQSPVPDSGEQITKSATLAEQQTSALIELPRSEDVCRELLRRRDVDSQTLHASLIRLARLREQATSELLIEFASSVGDKTDATVLQNLSRLAEGFRDDDAFRDQISGLCAHDKGTVLQRLALAMLISMDGDGDRVFDEANKDPQTLTFLLNALPLVHRNSIQASLYDHIQPLLFEGSGNQSAVSTSESSLDIQRTAIAVMVKLHGRDEEKAADLVRLVEVEGLQTAVIESFLELPPDSWPHDDLGLFASRVTAWIAAHSTDENQSPQLQTAFALAERISEQFSGMKRKRLIDRLMELGLPAK